MKQAFYQLHKQNIARTWQLESTLLQAFGSVPGCQTCMCKRGINLGNPNPTVLYFIRAKSFDFIARQQRKMGSDRITHKRNVPLSLQFPVK